MEKPKSLSPANFEIMKIIWEKKEVTINEVLDVLNEKRKGKLARTSVQVQMTRLEKYGWLSHRSSGRTFLYYPLHPKEQAVVDIVTDIRDRVFGGSSLEFAKTLFKDSDITLESMQEMRDLLEKIKD